MTKTARRATCDGQPWSRDNGRGRQPAVHALAPRERDKSTDNGHFVFGPFVWIFGIFTMRFRKRSSTYCTSISVFRSRAKEPLRAEQPSNISMTPYQANRPGAGAVHGSWSRYVCLVKRQKCVNILGMAGWIKYSCFFAFLP